MNREGFSYPMIWQGIAFGMALIVVVGSLLPVPELHAPRYSDKIVHLSAYGFLMWWFGQVYPPARRWLVALGLVALGLGIEWLQSLTAYRSGDWFDGLANLTGVAGGWLFVLTPLGRVAHIMDAWLAQWAGDG